MINQQNTNQSKKTNRIRVHSLNIRCIKVEKSEINNWQNRKHRLAEHLIKKDFDVIGVQEATWAQSQYLQEKLSEHGYIYCNQPRNSKKHEQCGIFLKKDKYQVVGQYFDWISESRKVDEVGYDGLHARYFTSILVANKNDNKDKSKKQQCILISNLHLDHKGEKARLKGLQQAVQRNLSIEQFLGNAYLFSGSIIMGDFNEPQESIMFQILKNNKKMPFRSMRSIENADRTFTINHFTSQRFLRVGQSRISPQNTIDHMFYWAQQKSGFQPLNFQVEKNQAEFFISDHYGITGTFNF